MFVTRFDESMWASSKAPLVDHKIYYYMKGERSDKGVGFVSMMTTFNIIHLHLIEPNIHT